jgi:hypothetical protein
VKIRFHKILSDGRTVKFDKADEPMIRLHLIVHRPPKSKDDA